MLKVDTGRVDKILGELPYDNVNEGEAAPEPTPEEEEELNRPQLALEDGAEGSETFDEQRDVLGIEDHGLLHPAQRPRMSPKTATPPQQTALQNSGQEHGAMARARARISRALAVSPRRSRRSASARCASTCAGSILMASRKAFSASASKSPFSDSARPSS